MTTPTGELRASERRADLTPERWREVDAILQRALSVDAPDREALVAKACAGDDALRDEVLSLLATDDRDTDDFLERPAAEVLGAIVSPSALAERLSRVLAGRYAIEREIARGGWATVFVARDLRHDRRVAIKVLRDELAAAVGPERFLAEIRVTAALQHPHILPLFDSGSADGLLWYVMPFVEGETLRSRIAREGRLPIDSAVQIVWEMADALDHAHRNGVVHRDVKPENVLLQDGHALVADFGVALALEQAGGERLTRTGLTLGTPQYMAPEQAAGERDIDTRADVYALGAVLHEMLTGEPPFAAGSPQAVMRRVMSEPAPTLAARRPEVPPFLDAAVRRALAKLPDDRFPTAAAFAAAVVVPIPGSGGRAASLGTSAAEDVCEECGARGGAHDYSRHGRSRGRLVSARSVVYGALVVLALGLVAGWSLARSTLAQRFAPIASAPTEAATQPSTIQRTADRWRGLPTETVLSVVDRAGRSVREIPGNRPWTPRFSPDGQRLAYGAYAGRNSSDLFVMDLESGSTQRLTDDDADSNDPLWNADGSQLVYSANAPGGKDLLERGVSGGEPRVMARRPGTQYGSDWLRDGSALLVTEDAGRRRRDIIVQPTDGSDARPFAATPADESAARVSPDGRWVAYMSDESGRTEVYLDSFREPGRRVKLSTNGGVHPVWRGDSRELYYWREGRLVALQLKPANGDTPPAVSGEQVLFEAPYEVGANTLYDVSPDGSRFAIVRRR